jgi:hypothetical protein
LLLEVVAVEVTTLPTVPLITRVSAVERLVVMDTPVAGIVPLHITEKVEVNLQVAPQEQQITVVPLEH